MELLERGRFLQSLLDCPPGRAVLVSGEAGIGKTSLLKAGAPLGPLHDIARQAAGSRCRDRPRDQTLDRGKRKG